MNIIKEQSVLTESKSYPCDGIFWIIDGEIVPYANDFNPHQLIMVASNQTHKGAWPNLAEYYTVNGRIVPFDYYPRGRVVAQYNNELNTFNVDIYMDNCLRPEYEDLVKKTFNLDIPRCNVTFRGNSGFGDSHYKCHMCKNAKKEEQKRHEETKLKEIIADIESAYDKSDSSLLGKYVSPTGVSYTLCPSETAKKEQ